MVSREIISPTIPSILKAAAAYSDEAFEKIELLISETSSTDPSDAEIAALSLQTGISDTDLKYLVSFVFFLYAQTEGVPKEHLESILKKFLSEHVDDELIAPILGRFQKLLNHRDNYDAATKAARLTRGFLPFFRTAATYVDIRVDFERGADAKLTGKTLGEHILVQLSLRNDARDPSDRHMLVQMDEAGLQILKDAIEDAEEKIKILSETH